MCTCVGVGVDVGVDVGVGMGVSMGVDVVPPYIIGMRLFSTPRLAVPVQQRLPDVGSNGGSLSDARARRMS